MIDYDKTIEKFFNSVKAFLARAAENAKDKDELRQIQLNQHKIGRIADNPKKYASYDARYRERLVVDTDGFMRANGRDNRVFVAFKAVLWALEKYYDNQANGWSHLAEHDKTALLQAIKTWNYRTSTNVLKDFVYPFKSLKSFAVHANKSNQR